MPENMIPTSTQQLIDEINHKCNDHNYNANNDGIKPYIEAIKSELTKLKTIAQDNLENLSKDKAFKMISHVQSAQATAQLLSTSMLATSSQGGLGQTVSNVINNLSNWVNGTLIPWLKNLWSSVWATIQKLTTPKEWKISGELGSTVFGLSKAQLEISF